MRAAPIGAYFADNPERASVQAQRAAAVTHAHPDGQAGAFAVAVAGPDGLNARDQFRQGVSLAGGSPRALQG